MKPKFLVVILVTSMGVVTSFAQSESLTDSMTEEQTDEFNQSKLSVDVGITTSATGSGFGVISLESYRRWTGRQGFNRLSESYFFEIAGYPQEAQKAAAYKQVGWTLLIGGGAICVGGFAWMLMASSNTDYEDPDYMTKFTTALYGGMALGLGGMIPAWIGSTRLRKNWASVEQAQIAADKYNRKLGKRILEGE